MVSDGLPNEISQVISDYDYLQWGFFFGDSEIGTGIQEHVHLGTWVAGEEAQANNLPTTGSATYTGHVIGNVYDGSSSYTSAGNFSNSWDFAARSGTVSMDFDSTAYTGVTELRDSSVVFDGRIDAPGREGALHGNFIQAGPDPAAGVIGRFSISNTDSSPGYSASGTFAAE